jgi:protein SCO1/2
MMPVAAYCRNVSGWHRLAAVAVATAFALGTTTISTTASAQAMGTQEEATPRELRSVKVDEQLDAQVPLDATFRDQYGKTVRLGDLIDGKRPTLLTFAYYNCPVLCSLILNSAVSSLSKIPWTIGREFDVITISIDPHETVERTKGKRESLLGQYQRQDAEHGWHFLTGDEAQIARVTDAVGYRFHYDEESKQFAHPGTLVLLQPNGRVSRYLYGLEYPPADLRLGLLEASQGKLISTTEQVLLFCYRYDARQGKYVIMANRVMQMGSAVVALGLGAFLGIFWYRERKKKTSQDLAAASPGLPREGDLAPSATSALSKGPVTPMESRT